VKLVWPILTKILVFVMKDIGREYRRKVSSSEYMSFLEFDVQVTVHRDKFL